MVWELKKVEVSFGVTEDCFAKPTSERLRNELGTEDEHHSL